MLRAGQADLTSFQIYRDQPREGREQPAQPLCIFQRRDQKSREDKGLGQSHTKHCLTYNFQALSLEHTRALWRPAADRWHRPCPLPIHVLALRPYANTVLCQAPGRMAPLPAHLGRISTRQLPSSSGSQPLPVGPTNGKELLTAGGQCRVPQVPQRGVRWQ